MHNTSQAKSEPTGSDDGSLEPVQELGYRLRSLISSMNDLVFVLDEKGAIREFYAPKNEDLFVEPSVFFEKPFEKIGLPPATCAVIRKAFDESLVSDSPVEGEYSLEFPDGTRWFELRASVLRGRRQKIEGVTFLIRNVTKFRLAQTQLEESRRQLQADREHLAAVIRGTNVGTWEWNIQTSEITVNARWADIIGHPLDSLEPFEENPWKKHAHPDDYLRCTRLLEEHFSGTNDYFEIELRMRHQNGAWTWVLDRGKVASWTPDGKPLLMYGTHQDIHEQKTALDALAAQEEKFRGLFELSPIGIALNDLQSGAFLDFNSALHEAAGYSREEFSGLRFQEITPPEYADQDIKQFFQIEETGRYGPFQKELIRKDGSRYPVILSGVLVPSRDGKKVAWSIVQDITSQKESEVALRAAKEKAEAANVAKSQFLANMSHEIRTPMNGVIGMSDLLRRTQLSPEQSRYTNAIHASAEALLGIINDILDFSKIEAGKLEIETISFGLEDLLDSVAESLGLKSSQKGIDFIAAIEPGTPDRLLGDPARLRQILTNLVGNAVKFTQAGEISLRVCPEEKNGDSVRLRFCVRDTGIGIPPEAKPYLFDKFTQADSSMSRKFGGTGLGLAITKQLVNLMGGEIWVNSPLPATENSRGGPGSEFCFALPFQTTEETGTEEPATHEIFRGSRALIVEDGEFLRKTLSERMGAWGLRTDESEDGPTALRMLYASLSDHDLYHVAVIDMQMLGMDGLSLGRAIRADRRLDKVRLVLLATLDQPILGGELSDAGFDFCIAKPVTLHELRRVLANALSPTPSAELPLRLPSTSASDLPPASRHARILLAEDNPVNREVAIGFLRAIGLRADAVSTGAGALSAVATRRYDLVLMDVQMPGMDGFQAVEEIRKLRPGTGGLALPFPAEETYFRNLPIVAMTAHAMDGDRERCLDAGMNDYLAKPLHLEDLTSILRKWLPHFLLSAEENQEPQQKQKKPTPPPIPPESPLSFERLIEVFEDEEIAKQALRNFYLSIPQILLDLRAAIASEDFLITHRCLHDLKGATGYFEPHPICSTLLTMQEHARNQSAENLKTATDHFEDQFLLIRKQIGEF